MNALLYPGILAARTPVEALLGVGLRGMTAVGPLPQLSFVLQVMPAATAVGAAVALRAKGRYGAVDKWSITTAWGTLGLIIAAVIVIVEAVA